MADDAADRADFGAVILGRKVAAARGRVRRVEGKGRESGAVDFGFGDAMVAAQGFLRFNCRR